MQLINLSVNQSLRVPSLHDADMPNALSHLVQQAKDMVPIN